MAGGVPVARIARWDGNAWSALGAGVGVASGFATVTSLRSSGTALFVGGSFTLAGGNPASNVARWDGGNWSALGSGLGGGTASALEIFGSDLYAAGTFNAAGGQAVGYVARWNGSEWQALASGSSNGVNAPATEVRAAGGALYIGGTFGGTLQLASAGLIGYTPAETLFRDSFE